MAKIIIEDTDFEKANQRIHPVESEWHHPILTKHGFVPITKSGKGFVRSYDYIHPTKGTKIKVTTGASADYWSSENPGGYGYPGTLESHLNSLKGGSNG